MKVTPVGQTLILASESGRDVTRPHLPSVTDLVDSIPLLQAVPIDSTQDRFMTGAGPRGFRASHHGRAVSLYSSTQQISAAGPTARRIDVRA